MEVDELMLKNKLIKAILEKYKKFTIFSRDELFRLDVAVVCKEYLICKTLSRCPSFGREILTKFPTKKLKVLASLPMDSLIKGYYIYGLTYLFGEKFYENQLSRLSLQQMMFLIRHLNQILTILSSEHSFANLDELTQMSDEKLLKEFLICKILAARPDLTRRDLELTPLSDLKYLREKIRAINTNSADMEIDAIIYEILYYTNLYSHQPIESDAAIKLENLLSKLKEKAKKSDNDTFTKENLIRNISFFLRLVDVDALQSLSVEELTIRYQMLIYEYMKKMEKNKKKDEDCNSTY